MWKTIIAPTLAVCLLWLLVSGMTTYGIDWFSRSHATVLTDHLASIRAPGVMQESLWRLQVALLDIADDERGTVPAEFSELEAQFERSLEEADKAATTLPAQDLVQQIRRRFSDYRDFIHRSIEWKTNNLSQWADIEDRAAQKARSVSEPCTELLTFNERQMSASVARAAQLERALYGVRLIFLMTGPGVGVYAGLRMARNLQTSIRRSA
jgi:hypothetical protein